MIKPIPHLLSLELAKRFEPLAEELGVSEVARSERGFFTAYKQAGGDWNALDPWWQNRRNNFVKRHMAQVEMRNEPLFYDDGTPTRRHLGLIMWAHSPLTEKQLEKTMRRTRKNPLDSAYAFLFYVDYDPDYAEEGGSYSIEFQSNSFREDFGPSPSHDAFFGNREMREIFGNGQDLPVARFHTAGHTLLMLQHIEDTLSKEVPNFPIYKDISPEARVAMKEELREPQSFAEAVRRGRTRKNPPLEWHLENDDPNEIIRGLIAQHGQRAVLDAAFARQNPEWAKKFGGWLGRGEKAARTKTKRAASAAWEGTKKQSKRAASAAWEGTKKQSKRAASAAWEGTKAGARRAGKATSDYAREVGRDFSASYKKARKNPANDYQIYVADLAAYNEGTLRGSWITPDSDPEVLSEQIQEVIAPNEEWVIHDYDNFPDMGENPDIEDIAAAAKLFEEHDADVLWAASQLFQPQELEDVLDEGYDIYDSEEGYVYRYVDYMGGPTAATLDRYFDYAAFGRDARSSYPDLIEELGLENVSDDHELGEYLIDEGLEDKGYVPKVVMESYFDYDAFGRDLMMDTNGIRYDGQFYVFNYGH